MSNPRLRKSKNESADANSSLNRNQDFALLALLLCGGGEGLAHIEDIALKAHELAPTRFKWEKHDYPSLDTARVSLRSDHGPDGAVQRTGAKYYSLTSAGLLRAIEVGSRLLGKRYSNAQDVISGFLADHDSSAIPRSQMGTARSRPVQKALRRIRTHETFSTWVKDSTAPLELWQLADLLECMPDASPSTWNARLEHLKQQATFWQDSELLNFADRIEKVIRKA